MLSGKSIALYAHSKKKERLNYLTIHLKTLKKDSTDSLGNSLLVQWLGLGAFTAEHLGSIPDQRTKIPQDPCVTARKTEQK